jgi:uridine kinase
MAFGLTGAPGTFQAVMNETLAPVLHKCAIVLFDDILIYSRLYEDHLKHLEQVLQLLQQHQWRVKDSKCQFVQRKISYLGYVISESGVSTDPKKIIDVQKWQFH